MSFKLGCREFVHTAATLEKMQIAAQTFKALGPPPAQCYPWHQAVEAATSGDWGMDGNDTAGDCVIAGRSHAIMAYTANQPGGKIVIPTRDETIKEYSIETGYVDGDDSTDQGTDPVANANHLVQTGMVVGGVTHKIDAWVPVDPSNPDSRKWAKHLFCGGGLCVNLPQSAMDQFQAGKPFTVLADDGGILGGHYILDMYYYLDAQGVLWSKPVTWAKSVDASEDWVMKYGTMYIAYLSKDFLNQQGADASGFDYTALVASLQSVAEPS